jgi:gliding motility-associated-like protein
VEGGTAPYQFQWSTHSSQRDQQHLPAGTYTVTVTDGNGCAASDSRTLEDPPQLDVTLTRQSDVLCFGGSDGALQATVEGGTPPYQYKWYNNLLTLSHRGAHATGLAQGSYSVAVTDSKGCTQTRSLNIRQPVQPLQADLTTMPALCNNEASGSIDLTVRGGKPPYQYSWSSGHSSEDLNNVHAGEYEVTVTDANGCTYTNKTRVVDPEPLRVSLMPSDVSCADQQDGSIKILGVFGGYPPFAFQWSNGETGEGIDGLAEGTYSVTIRDASGCEVTESRTIYTNEDDCLFIPNTFSPNGDGINDTWNIRNIQLYARATVRVYNRWGLSVFESQGYSQPWDGTYKGKDLEPSTYYYLVDLGNGTPVYQGYLIIVR